MIDTKQWADAIRQSRRSTSGRDRDSLKAAKFSISKMAWRRLQAVNQKLSCRAAFSHRNSHKYRSQRARAILYASELARLDGRMTGPFRRLLRSPSGRAQYTTAAAAAARRFIQRHALGVISHSNAVYSLLALALFLHFRVNIAVCMQRILSRGRIYRGPSRASGNKLDSGRCRKKR